MTFLQISDLFQQLFTVAFVTITAAARARCACETLAKTCRWNRQTAVIPTPNCPDQILTQFCFCCVSTRNTVFDCCCQVLLMCFEEGRSFVVEESPVSWSPAVCRLLSGFSPHTTRESSCYQGTFVTFESGESQAAQHSFCQTPVRLPSDSC